MNHHLNDSAGMKLLVVITFFSFVFTLAYAVTYVESTFNAVFITLLAFTVLRIVFDYDSPFSMVCNTVGYLIGALAYGGIVASGSIGGFVLFASLYFGLIAFVLGPIQKKEADKAVAIALKSKRKEDAFLALLRLHRSRQLQKESDIARQLIFICESKGEKK